MSPIEASEARLSFYLQNTLTVRQMLGSLSPDERVDQAVLLVDLRDPVGRAIIEAAAEVSGADLPAHERKVSASGEIPTGCLVVSRKLAAELVKRSSPKVSEKLLSGVTPAGSCYVAVIGHGGTALLLSQEKPLPPSGTA